MLEEDGSAFCRCRTNCGRSSGFSFGDMAARRVGREGCEVTATAGGCVSSWGAELGSNVNYDVGCRCWVIINRKKRVRLGTAVPNSCLVQHPGQTGRHLGAC